MEILNSEDRSLRTIRETQPVRPVISGAPVDQLALKHVCPSHAIGINPVRIDLGKCVFSGNCAEEFPSKVRFSGDASLATNVRDRLILIEGEDAPIVPDAHFIRENSFTLASPIRLKIIGNSMHNAAQHHDTVQFVESPAEAHGLVFTEAITPDMEETVKRLYEAVLAPKLMILTGAKAISGGVFSDRNKSIGFMDRYRIDLYIPGDAADALTLAQTLKELNSSKKSTNK